jgi:hypothetical protein
MNNDLICAFEAAVAPVAQLRKRALELADQLKEHTSKQTRLNELNNELDVSLDLQKDLCAKIKTIQQNIRELNLNASLFRDLERRHVHACLMLEHLEKGRGKEAENVLDNHHLELVFTEGDLHFTFDKHIKEILAQLQPEWPIASIARYDLAHGCIVVKRQMLELDYVLPPTMTEFAMGFSWIACTHKDCPFCCGESYESSPEKRFFGLCEINSEE